MDIVFFVFVAFAVWALSGLRIVRQQTVAVVEVLGKYQSTLSAGLNWIMPAPFGKVAGVLSQRIAEIKAPIDVKTDDNVFVSLPVTLMVQVQPGREWDAFYRLQKPEEQIKTWILNTVRSIVSRMTLDALFSDRTAIEQAVRQDLAPKLEGYGYMLIGLLVEQPAVSEELQSSFNRVVASEREKEAAEREGAAQRIKIVAAAQAEADGQVARARGVAEARRIIAEGFAESIEAVGKTAEGIGVAQVMDFLVTTNRFDAMRDVGSHGNLVVMDTAQPHSVLPGVLAQRMGAASEAVAS